MIRIARLTGQLLACAAILTAGCGDRKKAPNTNATTKPKSTQSPSTDAKPVTKQPTTDAAATKRPEVWAVSSDPVDKPPSRTKSTRGSWKVETSPDGQRVLVQRAKSPSAFFNLVLFATKAQDVDLKVRLKPISGRIDQGGGLVWRARDADNYYIARYNPLEDNYRLYKVVAGLRTMLASAKTKGSRTQWRELRCTAAANLMTCYLDGAKLLEHRDNTFKNAGHVGLWTKADAVTMFDWLSNQVAKR